jgi:hypothetical protein
MPRRHKRSFMGTTQPLPMLLACIGCVVFMFILLSCSSAPPSLHETPLPKENRLPLRYSMIFIVHGDGDYLYHDPAGRAHRADEEALAGAIRVAERNPEAEVFIFHQKSRRHTLLFFPHRDGKFYFYRYGRMVAVEKYRRHQGPSRFDPELELYRRFRSGEPPAPVKLFLYFGHEIPESGGAGYDASESNRTFTVHDLAGGLEGFRSDSTKFDLIVLSTCYNGTPHTIAALAPYARTIVASPENLHLSYLDLEPFERLDVGLHDGETAAFAGRFARRAFDRLTEDVQTAVTVAVYDVERVRGYLHTIDSLYENALSSMKDQPPGSVEHFDCAEDSVYVLPGMSDGVDVFFHPPRFGRSKHKQHHSGWECQRIQRPSPSNPLRDPQL